MCSVCSIATPQTYYFTLDEEKIYRLSENDTIGDRIKKLRKLQKLTSKELGEKIGVTGSGILGYENNKSYPSARIILKLYDLLGSDIACDEYSKFITSKYWERLTSWRNKNNLTKKNAAKILGLTESTLSYWENQKTYVTKYIYQKFKNKFKEIQLTT